MPTMRLRVVSRVNLLIRATSELDIFKVKGFLAKEKYDGEQTEKNHFIILVMKICLFRLSNKRFFILEYLFHWLLRCFNFVQKLRPRGLKVSTLFLLEKS